MQELHPIAYMSKALKGRALALSTYEKEVLAILQAVKHWRQYLLGSSFVIKTDQRSIKYMLEQKINTEVQEKWMWKLLGYTFKIEYKKGPENTVADGLSRRQGEQATYCEVTFVVPSWQEEVKLMVEQDPLIWLKIGLNRDRSHRTRILKLRGKTVISHANGSEAGTGSPSH